MGDEDGVAADAAEPLGHVMGIGNAAAEEEELRLWRGEGHGELVIYTAHRVGEHLVLVHHEEAGAFAAQEAAFLSLKGGDHHAGIEAEGEIAGGDADVPAATAPLGDRTPRSRARNRAARVSATCRRRSPTR